MSSAAWPRRSQRSQVSPSCPSIMMPTRMRGSSSGQLASDGGAPAPRRPAARTTGLHVYRTRTGSGRRVTLSSAMRLLLLIPTTTYRTEDFVDAARTLDVDLVIASDRPNVMSAEFPDHLLTLPFSDPDAAISEMRRYAARR